MVKEEEMLVSARKLKEDELYICERLKRNLRVVILEKRFT